MVATFSTVLYGGPRARAVSDRGRAARLSVARLGRDRRCRPVGGAVHRRPERVRLLRRRAAERIAGRTVCGRQARGSSRRPPRSPIFRRSISTSSTACRAAWRRPTGAAHPDVQPRRGSDHRRRVPIGRRPADRRRAAAAGRRQRPRSAGSGRRHAAPARVPLPHARRPRRHRDRPDGHPSGNAGRPRRFPVHVSGRHEHQEARARRARFSSGWPPSAKWLPASRTRSAIRSRRCRGPFRSFVRSCRSAASRSS